VLDGGVLGALPSEPTSYVGRDAEIQDGVRLLAAAPLVTLTGPPGVGKTRLAVRIAVEVSHEFDDVVFVPLAELHEPELLVATVAERIGLGDRTSRPALDVLVDALRTRRLLLVLDNCEHLVGACAQLVDALVPACSDLVVLATSRQSLGAAVEQLLPVPPLAVPEPSERAAQLERFDAVKLFLDRARAVVPSFEITEDNAADVVELCYQLDGLPLAIELAAVRLRSLSAGQLAQRLGERFTLLSGGRRRGPSRHETLGALVDWSHELCTEPERLLWARVSVFAGSFEPAAAEQVCSGDGLDEQHVGEALRGLVDKSVVLVDEQPDGVRYRLLETMRQYGQDRLRAGGKPSRFRHRHRDWYLQLSRRFEADWIGPDQLAWITRLRREHANLRVALDYCASSPDQAVIGLGMVFAIRDYWLIRGLNAEGRLQLNRLLAAAPDDAPGRADALWLYAFMALAQGDTFAYQSSITRASQVAEQTGDERARAYVTHVQAYAALVGNDMPVAAEQFVVAASLFAQQQHLPGELWSRYNAGISIALAGDLERGRQVLRECIEAYAARGEMFWRSWAWWSLGSAEYLVGDLRRALVASREVLRLQQLIGDRAMIAFGLTLAAGCAAHRRQYARCARLFGAAATMWQALGTEPSYYVPFAEPIKRDTDAVVSHLGLEQTKTEFAAGAAMSPEQALAYALADTEPGAGRAPDGPLTQQQRQIADLVASGMTNRELAKILGITQRAAQAHVEQILATLGLSTRAQLATWAAGEGH